MKRDWSKAVNIIIAVIMLGTLVYNMLSASDRAVINSIERQVNTNTSDIKELRNADARILQKIYDQQEKMMELLLEIRNRRRDK